MKEAAADGRLLSWSSGAEKPGSLKGLPWYWSYMRDRDRDKVTITVLFLGGLPITTPQRIGEMSSHRMWPLLGSNLASSMYKLHNFEPQLQ